MNIAIHVRNHPGAASIESLELASDNAFRKWIIDSSGFFVTEYDNKVSLIHQTAKDFLFGVAGTNIDRLEIKSPINQIGLPSAHAVMAESCISYLSLNACQTGGIYNALSKYVNRRFIEYWDPFGLIRSLLSLHEFLPYVVQFWLRYFRHAQRLGPTSTWIDIGDRYIPHYDSIFQGMESYQPTMVASLRAYRLLIHSSTTSLYIDSMQRHLPCYPQRILYWVVPLGVARSPGDTANDRRPGSLGAIAALCGHLRAMKRGNNLLQVSSGLPSVPPCTAPLGSQDQSLPLDPSYVKFAVIGRSVLCLEYLISCGISLTSRDLDNYTPLHWAVALGYPYIVDLLLNNGAVVNIQDDNIPTLLLESLSCKPRFFEDLDIRLSLRRRRGDLHSIVKVLLTREEARTIPVES